MNTAPVSNRSRTEAEENTPDLALSARKLADMRSLYREFSPTLQTALEDEYKNDPTGLRVIRGELSADDWLKEKQDARTAMQRKSSVDFVSTFNQSLPKPTLSAKRYNPHVYSLDQNGQLIQTERFNPSSFDKEYAFNLAAIEHIYEMEKWRKSNTGYRAPNQWSEVPSFSSAVPIFEKILFPQNNASGERIYSSQWLDLSPTLQRHIYEMCKISGVDYYLILATVAHESSSTMKEPNRLTASGYMQQLENLWWAYNRISADDRENAIEYPTDSRYEDTINRIYDYAQNADDEVDFTTSDASILHKNALTNLATGIAHYYVDFRLKEQKNNKYAIAHAVGSYGEGIGSAASYEVLYYRDLLALANGDAPWYMGDLYDIDGKNLNRIPESLESKDQ